MPEGPVGMLVMLLSFVLTFIVARALGNRFREKRRRQAQEKARAGESRQVRRARERGGKPR